jgi:hypothetical protein
MPDSTAQCEVLSKETAAAAWDAMATKNTPPPKELELEWKGV